MHDHISEQPYQGWFYQVVDDSNRDRHSAFHFAVHEDERTVGLHFSPLTHYTFEQFTRFVDLRFPNPWIDKFGRGVNWSPEDIDAAWLDMRDGLHLTSGTLEQFNRRTAFLDAQRRDYSGKVGVAGLKVAA